MAEPTRKRNSDIEPDIRPHFGVIKNGGETTPERDDLRPVDDSSTKDLQDQERRFGVIQGGGESTPERGNLQAVPDNIGDAREREQAGNWQTNLKNKPSSIKGKTKGGGWRRKGPIAAISGSLLTMGFLGFSGLTFMPVTI